MDKASYAVFGIVRGVPGQEGKVPLIQDKDKLGRWKLPGGTSETEYPQDALMRELAEEIGVMTMPNSTEVLRIPKPTHIVAFYSVEYYTGDPAPGEEVAEMKFFSGCEIEDLARREQIYFHHAQALAKYFGFIYKG